MKIRNIEFITSAKDKDGYPNYDLKEIVLLGRSNVGKSTFINSFVNNKKFAYTSQNPGKTQILNFFTINNKFAMVDVPGYGYAKVSKKKRQEFGEMIEEFLQNRENLKFVGLLIDFKVGPTEDDILMYDYLNFYNIPHIIIATKKDKVKKNDINKKKEELLKKLKNINLDNLYIYSSKDRNTLLPIYNEFKNRFNLNGEGNE